MSKKVKTVAATIKLVIKAGQAKPAPPVGPALGQAGLNIMNFCKDFNAKTADMKVFILLQLLYQRPLFSHASADDTVPSLGELISQNGCAGRRANPCTTNRLQ